MSSKQTFGIGNIIKDSQKNTPLAEKALAEKEREMEKEKQKHISHNSKKEVSNNDFLAPLAGRKGRKVNLELTDIQFEALDKASKDSRYSKREIMIMALKDYLEKNKYI